MDSIKFTYTDTKGKTYDITGFVDRYYDELTSENGMLSSEALEKYNEMYDSITTQTLGIIIKGIPDFEKITSGRKTYYKYTGSYKKNGDSSEDTDIEFLKKEIHIDHKITNKSKLFDIYAMMAYDFLNTKDYIDCLIMYSIQCWAMKAYQIMINDSSSKSFIQKWLKKRSISITVDELYLKTVFTLVAMTLDKKYKWSKKNEILVVKRHTPSDASKQSVRERIEQEERERREQIEALEKEEEERKQHEIDKKKKQNADALGMSMDEYISWCNAHKQDCAGDVIDYFKKLYKYIGKDLTNVSDKKLSWVLNELKSTEPDNSEIDRIENEFTKRLVAKYDKKYMISETNAINKQKELEDARAEYIKFCKEHDGYFLQIGRKGSFKRVFWNENEECLWYSITNPLEKDERNIKYIFKPLTAKYVDIDDQIKSYESILSKNNRWEKTIAIPTKNQSKGDSLLSILRNIIKEENAANNKKIMEKINSKISDVEDRIDDVEGAIPDVGDYEDKFNDFEDQICEIEQEQGKIKENEE